MMLTISDHMRRDKPRHIVVTKTTARKYSPRTL